MSLYYTWFYLKYHFYTLYFTYIVYLNVDEDVCCCGSSNCKGDYSHSYVNAKEYAIKSAVLSKVGK